MKIRILVAEDHKIVREGLCGLINRETEMEVIGEAENGRSAVQFSRSLHPEIVVMDISMPDLNGIEATKQILSDRPQTKVIGLSMHSDRRYVSRMLQAGAKGYLLKDCAFDELILAIKTVRMNRIYLSPQITSVVVENLLQQGTGFDASRLSRLSSREREVLQLIAEGKSTKEIGGILHVSTKTIESHRQHLMEKLQITNLADLVKFAIREGLTSLDM